MTLYYYFHQTNELFEIDRMPPENNLDPSIHKDNCRCALCIAYSQQFQNFLTHITRSKPIPHTFSGESRVIPPNQIEWDYQVWDRRWQTCSQEDYEKETPNMRRRVATPKITEGGKKSNKFPWEKHMKDDETCVPSNEDLYALEGEPLTAQPDKPRVEMPEWFSWQQVDFLISKFVCDFAPQHSTVESPGQFIKRGVEHPHFPSPPSPTPETGEKDNLSNSISLKPPNSGELNIFDEDFPKVLEEKALFDKLYEVREDLDNIHTTLSRSTVPMEVYNLFSAALGKAKFDILAIHKGVSHLHTGLGECEIVLNEFREENSKLKGNTTGFAEWIDPDFKYCGNGIWRQHTGYQKTTFQLLSKYLKQLPDSPAQQPHSPEQALTTDEEAAEIYAEEKYARTVEAKDIAATAFAAGCTHVRAQQACQHNGLITTDDTGLHRCYNCLMTWRGQKPQPVDAVAFVEWLDKFQHVIYIGDNNSGKTIKQALTLFSTQTKQP